MTRTYDEIRQQVREIKLGKSLPALAWVGNEKSLKARDEWFKMRDDHRQRCADLAKSINCDTEKIWTSGRGKALCGFAPLDPDSAVKALRPDAETAGMWVPNRRTKLGKELAKSMEEINQKLPPKDPEGVEGSVFIKAPGGFRDYYPVTQVMRDSYPVVAIGVDPADGEPGFGGEFRVDPELYDPIPVSWLVRISEEHSYD